MPFKSKAQQRWMYANEPAMAERWADETPHSKKLPAHVQDGSAGRTLSALVTLPAPRLVKTPSRVSAPKGGHPGGSAGHPHRNLGKYLHPKGSR